MNESMFLTLLAQEGFSVPVTVVREPGGFLESHTQSDEVKVLVIEGQIDIVIKGIKSSYLAGDVFHLLPHQIYSERYGSKGVRYLAGRRDAATQEEHKSQNQGTA